MRNFFIVVFCIICSTTFAKVVAEGECGRHATWSLDDEGTLQIEGKGPLHHYYWGVKPWDRYYEDIKRIVVTEGITKVHSRAFDGLPNLESLSLPSTLKHISGECSASTAEKFMNIHVHNDNPYYCSVDGVLYNKQRTTLVMFPPGREGQYRVLDGVTVIGRYAFCHSLLDSVILPQSLNRIEWCSFANSRFTRIDLPEQLKFIDSHAFFDANAANIHLPSKVKNIKYCAFANCKNLEEIVIDAESNKIPKEAFLYCSSLKSVKVIGKTKKICKSAFYGCVNLESVDLGGNMRKISKGAFDNCKKLKSVTIMSEKTRKPLSDAIQRSDVVILPTL